MPDKEPIMALVAVGRSEAERLSQEHSKPITVDSCALIMLARIAIHKADSEDYMRDHVRIIVDDMIRRAPEATAYKYEYEPADADERRQSGHVPPNISF